MSVAILDVDRGPTHLEVRQQEEHVAFFLPVNPTAAMKKYQRRVRTRSVPGKIEIEFQFDTTCLRVRDIRENVILAGDVIDPAIGIRLTVCRSADYTDYTDQKKNLRN